GNSLGVKDYLIKIFENSNDKVQFTLPSFPFKVPNALKTEHHNLDAGEILCLQRLYLITYLTQELLNKKSEFIVISDGAIYSDLCNIDPFEYKAYSQKAKTVITKMGISENVKYVDMMNDVISEKTNEYTNTLNQVKDELQYWWQKNCETSKVKYLITNMAGNIKTDDLDYSVLRSMDHENASDLFDIYSEKIQKRASQSAFEFTAKLVTLRIMNVVLKKYEGCVRSTVHPKQGQYGIHLVNSSSSIFPWQGVLLKQTTNKFNMAPSQIALQKATSEVFDIDSGDFFYYAEKNAQLGNPL
ncbi:L-tyrosine/L-tryptophan isonitrile synthase family protein, partial [uncultured Leuconostoc sp.]|uniref:L-tyrosine/L-tryptophan isonitrile synthase family protein n=1 Tax=uncultured Leuconostoc sp. TaxID=173262 RepID=UPI0025EED8AC